MKIALMLCMFFLALSSASAAPEASRAQESANDKSNQAKSWYDEGVKQAKENNYEKALEFFQKAVASEPNNPSVLNMLAFTQRKLGKLDEAFANYEKALSIRNKFPEAREYLGEAHIQAALKQIDILKSYGDDAKEEHEDLVRALKDAAAAVN